MTLTGPEVLTSPPWAQPAKTSGRALGTLSPTAASELVLAASHLAAAPHEEPA